LAPIGLATGGVAGREHHATLGTVGTDTPDAVAPDDYSVSAAKELLRQNEGLLTNAKYDTNAYRTGYGSDTITQPDGTVVPVTAETSITKDDAERDLARRTALTQQGIQSKIGADTWGKLSPDTRVALTSTAYNYGSLPDAVAEAAKSGGPSDIATALNGLGGANEGVNAVRRSKEASIIDPQGKYDPMAAQPKASATPAAAPTSIGDWVSKQAQDPNMLLSILSGLGTMAGSNSRYLGAAILQGLGGGAEMYKGLQQQGIERQRVGVEQQRVGVEQQGRGIEALRYLQGRYLPRYDATGRNIISYQDTTGAPDLSPQDYGKVLANAASGFNLPASMTPSGTQAPAGGAVAKQPEGTPAPEDDLAAINNVDYTDVGSLSRAAVAARRLAQGTADPTAKAAWNANADHFTTTAGSLATTGKETSYAIQANAQRDQLARAVDAQELKNNALAQRANMFGPDGKPLENAGKFGDQLNDLASIAKQAGFAPETIKAILGFDPANGDTVNKLRDAIGSETGQLQDARAASALTRVFGGTPGNQIVPEASKWIIDNVIVPKADNEITTAKAIEHLDPLTDKITAKIMEEKTSHPWFNPKTPAATSEGTKAPAPAAASTSAPAPSAFSYKDLPTPLIKYLHSGDLKRNPDTGNFNLKGQWYDKKTGLPIEKDVVSP